MAKNKDPYKNIQRRFIEARAEDKGWEELTVEQRQRLANRFDVLAQTVEGRGKIAQTVLPPDVDPTRRREFRQRIKKNLPTKSNNTTTQSNINTDQASDLNKGIPAPWNAPNLNFRASTYVPPARQTTTQSTSQANVRRQVTGDFGSTYKPSAFANYAADVRIPVVSDLIGPGLPVARVIRQGAKELDEAYMAFKQGEIKEGLKNTAGVARELAFGAFDAGLVKVGVVGGGKLALRVGRGRLLRGLGRVANKTVGGAARFVDDVALGGLGQAATKKVRGNRTTTVNETRPVASTTERVVASEPQVRQATTATETASRPRLSGEPKRRRSSTPTVKTDVEPVTNVQPVADLPTSSPTRAPEIVPSNPVKVEGTTPPTEFQKTVTPAQFTEPAAVVQPASAATSPAAAATPKRAKRTKKVDDVQVTPVEPAKGSPAQGEVVGGAAPKENPPQALASSSKTSPQQNLPNVTESRSSTSAELITPTSTAPLPKSSPKKARSRKSASANQAEAQPVIEITDAQREQAKRAKLSPEGFVRRTEIVSIEIRIDPTTGQPILNPKTGKPAERIVYKSQRQMFDEAELRRARRKAERAADAEAVVTPVNPASEVKTTMKDKDYVELVVTVGDEAARVDNTVRLLPGGGIDPGTDAGRKRLAAEAAEVAEGAIMRGERARFRTGTGTPIGGEYVTKGARTLRQRRKAPQETRAERLERISQQGSFDPKTGKPIADNRTVEEIRAANEQAMRLDITKRGTKRSAADRKELDDLLNESVARQRKPEDIKASQRKERADTLRLQAEKIRQEQSVGRRRVGKTGLGIEGRFGEVRAKSRRQMRRDRMRTIPDDPTAPLHALQVNKTNLKNQSMSQVVDEAGVVRNVYDPYVETINALEEAATNLKPRQNYLADPDASFVMSTPEPPKGVEFFEYDPRKIDYEQLLSIEQAGFKLQVKTGAPTRFSKDRGVRGIFSLEPGKSMSPAKFRDLTKSTEFSRQDLIRLIKSTTGKK